MKTTEGKTGASRPTYFAAAALFLFFLVYSVPHRVHHFFFQPLSGPCPVFSIVKGCHLQPAAEIQLPVVEFATKSATLSLEAWIPYVASAPSPIRAPPVA